MHSFALAQALDRLERENENLYEAELGGERSNARLAILAMRVRAAEREVEEIKRHEAAQHT